MLYPKYYGIIKLQKETKDYSNLMRSEKILRENGLIELDVMLENSREIYMENSIYRKNASHF